MVAAVEFGYAVGVGDGETRAERLPGTQKPPQREAKIANEKGMPCVRHLVLCFDV